MEYKLDKNIKTGIYKITNNINKRYYIGSAYVLYKRFKEHRSALESNRHHNRQLTRFVNKYGICNLNFELLEECNITELESKEQYYISNTKNIFNETLDVKSPNRGKKLSKKHKQNISNSIKAKNIIRSEETKAKISKANKGHKFNLGKHHSEETKQKISHNVERNKKISESLKGRKVDWVKHTLETKQKIGEKNKYIGCKPILQLDKDNNILKEWYSISEASRCYSYISNMGSVRSSISDCLRGKTKTSLKFKWKYKI
jgi:group I intron endonuclease